MSTPAKKETARRQQLLDRLLDVGREHSTATVLFHSAISEKMGLGVTDMKTLDHLARLGPLTPGEISRHTGLATASVTELIDRLEKKGFVQRVRDTGDRRKVIVEPRMERESEFLYLFRSFGESLMQVLEGYSEEQLQTIVDFLSKAAEVSRREALTLREEQDVDPRGGNAGGARTKRQ